MNEKKVWVVFRDDPDPDFDPEVKGVFTNEGLAQLFVAMQVPSVAEDMWIESYPLWDSIPYYEE